MKSVLQDWVMELPLREQGTLLTGIRGCDVATKLYDANYGEPPERALVAFLRFCTMHPADPREVDVRGAFFRSTPPAEWKASQFGHYPQHWYSHVMHCFEVVGFRHPDNIIGIQALDIYHRFVYNMHLKPEYREEMIKRLSEDRIAANSVVS